MEIDKIINIIKEPVHGVKFYNKETLNELQKKIQEICSILEIDENTPKGNIIDIINNYIKINVSLRDSYFDAFCERVNKFDKNELIYRTAYGALVKKEAMCAGYAEALRILLSQYGIQTYTLLSKLPGQNKRLLHYVTVVEYEDYGEKVYKILDPERQLNCEKKGMDYEKYKSNMIYMLPKERFTQDVVGEKGVGIEAEEYMKDTDISYVRGEEDIKKLIENESNNLGENDGEKEI